ncbi:stage II sporulation protein P [Thalassobacillus sp. CUG 92003]|uniref:stage II sporulation protein P n=1 Tax=Thalassobacillus sp. CUG 92003 TaxID=2736641 RepID=UPI0015E7768E|nr:stage II sporulation protein P [Thalassobacillus sp. CUG 92003]
MPKRLLKPQGSHKWKRISQWTGILVAFMMLLMIGIGVLTGAKTTYRVYSDTVQEWTSQLPAASFLYLFQMENRVFKSAYPSGHTPPNLSSISFNLLTSLTPNDPRSLLGREIPGLASYNGDIIIAGEGTDYTNLPIESQAPIDVVQKDREAVDTEEQAPERPEPNDRESTNGKEVVFIYHTHNRESFLPHLPEGTPSSEAYHGEVNITKVGDRLSETLKDNGIGTKVDKTDVTQVLNQKGMPYYQSYDASRPIVEAAATNDNNFKYFMDLHRDSLPKNLTTTTIKDKPYARLIFVVGAEHPQYEKNLKLASDLHKRLEQSYPGLSRGVITKKGAGVDGKYNQDISQNAMLIEFGGVGNNLDELYRSADAMADVFSDYYWDAEKVTTD